MTRRMSAILGEYSPAGQGCTRHFSVPPLEYKNSTSYKKYRPNFGLNIQESYGKRPIITTTPNSKILKSSHQHAPCHRRRVNMHFNSIHWNIRPKSCKALIRG